MKTLTFEKGVSDHHKLVGVMLRSTFPKKNLKKMFYCCYKNSENKIFQEELQKKLLSVSYFESFYFTFKVILHLLKKTFLRNNKQIL